MRRSAAILACGLGLLEVAPAAAQSELQLRQALEGQYVIVKMEMPATKLGIDVNPMKDPSIDFQAYSARIRQHGVALREGDRILITTVRVKKKNIEVQLGGGGYGVWGDETDSVYVPSVTKSNREKDLEKRIKNEPDREYRRRMERELDDLKRERERENRDREMEKRALEERKRGEIAEKRRDAGSRVNLWFDEAQLAASVPSVADLREMLSPVLELERAAPRKASSATAGRPSPLAPPAPPPASGGAGDLRRGMSVDEVHDLLGTPARTKKGKQGELATLTEWYEDRERLTEIVYVADVIVRFSTSSR